MATATHIPTELLYNQGALSSTLGINFGDSGSGHFTMGIVVAGSGIPNTQYGGVTTIANVTAANTELSYSGYSRQVLTGVTWADDANNVQIDWSWSNVTWAQNSNDPGTGRYAFIGYFGPSGSYTDSAAPVAAILDFGQTVNVVNGSLVVECPSGGLIQFTGGG